MTVSHQASQPVLEPRDRKVVERLCFDESKLIINDYSGNFIEFQFEEIRLRDYRSAQLDEGLFAIESNPHFQRDNPASSLTLSVHVPASPTLNTQYAMAELNAFMKGTPTMNRSGTEAERPSINDPTMSFDPNGTIDFDELQSFVNGAADRNKRRTPFLSASRVGPGPASPAADASLGPRDHDLDIDENLFVI